MCKSYLEASKQNVKHSYILYENTLDWTRLSSPSGPYCWLNSHRKSLLALRRISRGFFQTFFQGTIIQRLALINGRHENYRYIFRALSCLKPFATTRCDMYTSNLRLFSHWKLNLEQKQQQQNKQGILTQCSRVHKSLLLILVGLKRSFGIPKDVKEYTEILSEIEYFYL